MKKTFTLLSLLITMLVEAVAQNDAMFVYRNDGAINGFLKSDIDSIRYSNFDVDSVLHKEYVVQEVWTVDSVYRIPLAAIDSVSFVTPPTVYKEGVIKMGEELVQYVISADSLTLQLKPDTPTSLIPQTDDLLVLLEGCEVLPNGFSGKVKSINTQNNCIEVVCEQTYIEDVFDSFCCVQTVEGYADENNQSQRSSSINTRAIYNPKDIVFHLGPYTASESGELSLGVIWDGDLAFKGGASSSVTVKPTFRIHTFLILGEGQDIYFNCSITGNVEVSSLLSIYGGLDYKHEFLNPVLRFPIPYTGGLVNFYINPGLFIRANAVISSTMSDYRNYVFGMAFDYSSKGGSIVAPSIGGSLTSSSLDMEGSIDGSLALGLYMETGFNLLCRKLARVCARGELGGQINGNFVLRNSDIENVGKESVLYETLKASNLEIGPFVNVSLVTSLSVFEVAPTWQLSGAVKKCHLAPSFQNTKLTRSSGKATSVDAYSELTGDCVFPVPIGYKLFDGEMNEVADYDSSLNYTNNGGQLKHSFDNITIDKDYTLYPTVKLFGYELLASPSAKLTNAHTKITRFDVTDSEYKQGAFMNDGLYYDYKFNVSLTVEIEDLDGVEDWGYVYRDPYGNIKRISLMEYGKSYTDTRYSYYRNEAHSTACLYTYVKYEGDLEYYDSEPQDFELYFDNPSPMAITGDYFDVTSKSATVKCSFRNVPEGATCGVEYGIGGNNHTVTSTSSDGEKKVNLSELQPSTTYSYRAFIQYEEEYYYGETKSFTTKETGEPDSDSSLCPDSNHPHVIDLGLPSGTKWSCCNVGASRPEEYGGYFAWGETEEKTSYSGQWDDYQYYSENTGLIHIGNDICGTKYDVAYVKWGGAWSMPSQGQMQELLNNCSYVRSLYNGIDGLLFKGPNGNSIFLPAAGYKLNSSLCDPVLNGRYWSGTLYEDYQYCAYRLSFIHGMEWLSPEQRSYGCSVRPITK